MNIEYFNTYELLNWTHCLHGFLKPLCSTNIAPILAANLTILSTAFLKSLGATVFTLKA